MESEIDFIISVSSILIWWRDFWKVHRAYIHYFIVFLNLSWQLLQHFSCQHYSIVLEFTELNELNQISNCFVSFAISKLAVIVVQFLHYVKWSISYAYDNYAQWQPATRDYLINDSWFIMNFTISQNEDNHILVNLFLELSCFKDCLL